MQLLEPVNIMCIDLGWLSKLKCAVTFMQFTAYFAEIVTSPSNEVTLPGGNATFNCVVNGAGFWTVNRKDPSTIPGFEATISEDQNDSGSIITTMSLSAQGLLSNNASLVLCNGIDYAGRITGSSAVLIIAGRAFME